jgi:hypothetical protein
LSSWVNGEVPVLMRGMVKDLAAGTLGPIGRGFVPVSGALASLVKLAMESVTVRRVGLTYVLGRGCPVQQPTAQEHGGDR